MPKFKRSDGEEKATDFVESLDRGLRLLQVFGERSSPMTLSEVAIAAGLPRATARRILFTLQHAGFVASDGKQFALTPHVLTLAGYYLRSTATMWCSSPARARRASSPAASTSATACRRSARQSAAPCSLVSAMRS